MKLTPLDIKKQEFKMGFRGFDPIEVESFLEMVAEEYESAIRGKNVLADEVLKLKTQLQDYQNVERVLQDTLVSAQESVKVSRESSEREADSIVKEAELKAEKILEDAKLKLSALRNELLVVKAQKGSFATRLKHLLESQLELLEVLELDDIGFKRYEDSPREHKADVTETEEVQFGDVDDVLPQKPLSSNEHAPNSDTFDPRTDHVAPEESVRNEQNAPPSYSHAQPLRRLVEEVPRGGQNVEDEAQSADTLESSEDRKTRITDHLVID